MGEKDKRWNAPYNSSEMDSTLMFNVINEISERERVSMNAGGHAWGNHPTQIFIKPNYQHVHINIAASLSTGTGPNAAAASAPSTDNKL